mgnify:FL=1
MMIDKYDTREIVAFTGHRSIDPKKVESVKRELITIVKTLYAKGVRIYLSGMAIGFDMLAAEVILSLKPKLPSLKLISVIPFRNQHNRWNINDKKRYNDILAQADDSIVLSEWYFNGCYLKRNDFMINHSCGLIAYYNGTNKGGTFYTIRKAKSKGKDILNIF